jgi:methylmalonyl-CoA mutase
MNEAPAKKPLFSEFKPVSPETWNERIRKDLRDAPYNSLLWQSNEGITVKPFYTRHDLPQNLAARPDDFPYVRTTKTSDNSWENVQTFFVRKDCNPCIEAAAQALSAGATGIHFVLKEPVDFNFELLLNQPGVRGAFFCFKFPV